jgi:hypothetical protein
MGALLVIEKLEELGATFASIDGIDSSTPEGKLHVHIMLSFAQYELERIKRNFHGAQRRAVEDGVHISGRTPVGYRRENGKRSRLITDPNTAPLVRECYVRRVDGASWQELSDFLRENGVPMSKSGVASMVTNRVYLGEARGPGGLVNPNAHEPLVTVDEWEAAQPGELRSPRNGSVSDRALLTGLVRCNGCGHRLTAVGAPKRRKDGSRIVNYACRGRHADGRCPAPAAVNVERLDAYVSFLLTQAAADHEPHVAAVIEGDDRYQRAQEALVEARAQLEAYVETADVASLGKELFEKGLRARQNAVTNARRRLRETPPPDEATESDRLVTFEEFLRIDARASMRKFIGEVRVKWAGGRTPGRPRPPIADRAEVYWVGADAPWRPIYAKLSKADEAKLPR